MDSIIKKIKKREKFLSQPIIDRIGNFQVKMRDMEKINLKQKTPRITDENS